jgi:hypothetical protein
VNTSYTLIRANTKNIKEEEGHWSGNKNPKCNA